jgi:hypothetical protein
MVAFKLQVPNSEYRGHQFRPKNSGTTKTDVKMEFCQKTQDGGETKEGLKNQFYNLKKVYKK